MKKYYVLSLLMAAVFLQAFAQGKAKPKVSPKRAPIDTARYVLVEGGSYTMGTDQPVEVHEAPAHKVSVNSFYLAKNETTFEDFDKYTSEVKKDSVPSGTWGRGKQAVFMVSWLDAVEYCNWLSAKEKLSKCYLIKGDNVTYLDTANGYRLPTEAEWEFAARGGNKSKGYLFAGSADINAVGWYKDNSGGKAKPVALKAPNELGIFDMTGNVWEWVWDVYDGGYYKTSPADNPKGPDAGPYRVMRGGAWYNDADHAKVFSRQDHYPTFRQNSVGFRVARTYY
jgi:formylglycine-generating enzyme